MAVTHAALGKTPEPKLEKIIQTVRELDITVSKAWPKLDELSSRTIVDHLEVLDDSVIVEGDRYIVPINVYVDLNYGKGQDSQRSSEAFPGRVVIRFGKKDGIVVEHVEVDTSSFFE